MSLSHFIIPTLFCGEAFSISIDSSGDVYSFGENKNGQCSHLDSVVYPPKRIDSLQNIKSVSCGLDHSIFCDYNGKVWTVGCNNNGQLGIDTNTKEINIPQSLNLPFINQVSCGNLFTICLCNDGSIYTFGSNLSGQLGRKSDSKSSTPQQIPNFNNNEYIICGGHFVYSRTYSGDYYYWGDNKSRKKYKEPNICDDWPKDIISIKCGSSHTLLLTDNGNVYGLGDNSFYQIGNAVDFHKSTTVPIKLNNLPFITQISTGNFHSMCIDTEKKLYTFGYNHYGQLGIGSTTNSTLKENKYISNVIDISSKGFHTLIKTEDNKIYGFGWNNKCQTGKDNGGANIIIPTRVLEDYEEIWSTNYGKSRAKSARK